jgi:hypothetical protein
MYFIKYKYIDYRNSWKWRYKELGIVVDGIDFLLVLFPSFMTKTFRLNPYLFFDSSYITNLSLNLIMAIYITSLDYFRLVLEILIVLFTGYAIYAECCEV